MTVYVTHSRSFDFKNELYVPIRNSNLNTKHSFILPHESSDEPYNSRDLILNKKCDLVLAEVSQAATGQGIELGWTDATGIPIICFYKQGSKLSGSLRIVSTIFVEYTSQEDMIAKLIEALKEYE